VNCRDIERSIGHPIYTGAAHGKERKTRSREEEVASKVFFEPLETFCGEWEFF
jgi:hypothetical protein